MKREISVICLTLVIMLSVAISARPSDDTFTSTASLFTIGTGARPLGMGNAFVGLADDENALLYNPAGLAFLEKPRFTSFYSSQYSSIHYGSVGYADTNFGVGYLQLSSGTLTKRDLYGNPTGEFSYMSRGLMGAYGTKIGNNFAWALQGKTYQMADPSEAQGYSLSPALLYKLESLQFGAVFKNLLSSDITYSGNHTETWQREITIGVAYCTERLKIDLDLDTLLSKRGINPQVAKVGAEGKVFRHLFLRAGLTSKLQSSVGLGVEVQNWRIDYSLHTHHQLPSTHRLSVTASFGKDAGITLKKIGEGFTDFFSKLSKD